MRRGPIAAAGAALLAGAGFLLAAVPLGARTAALPSGNIVLNPGFEDGPGSADGHFVALLPRWHRPDPSSGFTAVRYGASGGFPGSAVRDDVGGQSNFLAGGPRDGAKAVLLDQQVDLSQWSNEIDRGGVQARVSAYIGGYQNDADAGTVTFEQYGTPNDLGFSQFFGSSDLGPVTPGDRGGQTKLLRRSDTFAVHSGARSLKVILRAVATGGDYTNVFFDNISVELFSGAPPPTGTQTGGTTTGHTTTSGTTTGSTTTGSKPPPPPPKKAKATLSLGCARHRLVAAVKPAKGVKIAYVGFTVNGKLRSTDRKSPFALSLSTKGLKSPVKIAAVVHLSKTSKLTLRKQHALCR